MPWSRLSRTASDAVATKRALAALPLSGRSHSNLSTMPSRRTQTDPSYQTRRWPNPISSLRRTNRQTHQSFRVSCAHRIDGRNGSSNPPSSPDAIGGRASTVSPRNIGLRLREARRDDPHSPRVAGIERDLTHLEHLRSFALPLIREFDEWPDAALWGAWLRHAARAGPARHSPATRRPARTRRVAPNGRDWSRHASRSPRSARGSSSDRRHRTACRSIRPRVRRPRGTGPRARVPRGVRSRAGRARVPAEGA